MIAGWRKTSQQGSPSPLIGGIMKRSKEIAVAKILSRFDGDVWKEIDYCGAIAKMYPRLYEEYAEYKNRLVTQARGDQQ